MAAERTRRTPRRPAAYFALIAIAVLALAVGVAGTLWIARTQAVVAAP